MKDLSGHMKRAVGWFGTQTSTELSAIRGVLAPKTVKANEALVMNEIDKFRVVKGKAFDQLVKGWPIEALALGQFQRSLNMSLVKRTTTSLEVHGYSKNTSPFTLYVKNPDQEFSKAAPDTLPQLDDGQHRRRAILDLQVRGLEGLPETVGGGGIPFALYSGIDDETRYFFCNIYITSILCSLDAHTPLFVGVSTAIC
jgi:hypothetical protein